MADTRPAEALDQAYSHCADVLKALDPDRHLALLFAPNAFRRPLIALHAFSAEIAAIRDSVREALPGEIRQQWWRDAILARGAGDSPSSPVAQALFDTMAHYALPAEPLLALIDARSFDLYDGPMLDWNELEGYCGETSSLLFRLSTIILADGKEPGGAALCGHAGVAYALTGLLRSFPIHARRRQCYLPASLLGACGVNIEEIFAGKDSEPLRAALAQMRARAREHLIALREGSGALEQAAAPALRAVSLCEPYLRVMERADYRPFETLVDRTPLGKLWTLWRGRF